MPGGIVYSQPSGAQPPFVNLKGARNGASVDSSSYVVLGETIGEAGSPAALLNDREIPMEGFYLDLFGGILVVSADSEAPVGDALLQISRPDLGGSVFDPGSLLLINPTPATIAEVQNTPSIILQGAGYDVVGGVSVASAWQLVSASANGSGGSSGVFVMQYLSGGAPVAIAEYTFTSGGAFIAPSSVESDSFLVDVSIQFLNDPGHFYGLIQDSTSTPMGTLYFYPETVATDACALAAANYDDGTNREFFALGFNEVANFLTLNVHAQGTGIVRPVALLPNISYGAAIAPTAIMHIQASPGTPGNGPLKLTAGTLLATPENGLFEYDGTNLYFTPTGGIRKTVTLI